MKKLSEVANELTPERIIELVTQLGADRYIETDKYIIFPTICHNIDAAAASMKLYYYKANKKFHCYTDCGDNFNIFELFERRYKLLGMEYNFFTDVVLKISMDVQRFNEYEFFQPYKSPYQQHTKPKVDIEELPNSLLNVYTSIPIPEWLDDGISEDTMKLYNILYSIDENRIIIPHYDINGRLIGIRARALNEEDVKKGKYRPVIINGQLCNHPLGYNLYGLNIVKNNIKQKRWAIIGEGEKLPQQFNTMFGEKNNIAVATCGSSVSSYQIDLLTSVGADKILIAFDNEGETWEEKQKYFHKLENLCKKYSNRVKMGFIWDSKNLLQLKDSPTDRGKDTFLELYKGAKWIE